MIWAEGWQSSKVGVNMLQLSLSLSLSLSLLVNTNARCSFDYKSWYLSFISTRSRFDYDLNRNLESWSWFQSIDYVAEKDAHLQGQLHSGPSKVKSFGRAWMVAEILIEEEAIGSMIQPGLCIMYQLRSKGLL